MDKKEQIHKNILSFLDDYLKNTPKHIIAQEVKEISSMNFAGTTAHDYFTNFHKYYLNIEDEIPETSIKTSKSNQFSVRITRNPVKGYSYRTSFDKNPSTYTSRFIFFNKDNVYNVFRYSLFKKGELEGHLKQTKKYRYV